MTQKTPTHDSETIERMKQLRLTLEPYDTARLANFCGPLDKHLHLIEEELAVEIRNRGNVFELAGKAEIIHELSPALYQLYEDSLHNEINSDDVFLLIREIQSLCSSNKNNANKKPSYDDYAATHIRTRKGLIKARGENQALYIKNVLKHDINFGVGPAGTGKTWLAVACAVDALEREQVRRIILTRPAVEAGERLGFLPGDLREKVDPYLRPLYDALYEMLGFERVAKLIEKHVIEIAPLAYMRGRTLNNAFIILDEAQNTTPEQMKMFLTRIGFSSKAVITGDPSQTDLPPRTRSGLVQSLEVLQDEKQIGVTRFEAKDVVRHQLVQRIVVAYERWEEKNISPRD